MYLFSCKATKKYLGTLVGVLVMVMGSVFAAPIEIEAIVATTNEENTLTSHGVEAYFDLYETLQGSTLSDSSISLTAEESEASAPVTNLDGQKAVVLEGDNAYCQWSFSVNTPLVCSLKAVYHTFDEYENDITVSLEIDGKNPFAEAAIFTLPRKWKSLLLEGDYPFEKDSRGDDIRPEQVQVCEWQSAFFENSQGLYDEPYLFSLNAGKHTVRITVSDTKIALGGLVFENDQTKSYEEYIVAYGDDVVKGDEITYLQAERSASSSSPSLYPTYDKLDAATMPNDPKNIYLNIIGGSNWKDAGDSISWKVNVPQGGLYRVAFRARQNINSGLISYRTLLVNGEVPFEEARNVAFTYSQGWNIVTLGGEEEYMLYLEPGDILTLSCTTGGTAGVLRSIQNTISDLNVLYRQVISITSASPDIYQDYNLEGKIPDLEESLWDAHDKLIATYEQMCDMLGTNGSLASSLNVSARTLEKFAKAPYEIPESLSSFKSVLETLGSLVLSLSEQPLELDYIAFMPSDAHTLESGCGFFESIKFVFKQFLFSFSNNYSVVGESAKAEKNISVWASTGRDQASIISQLITSRFTDVTGIGVNLSLVDTGNTLVRASLAGKGPDVALMMPQGTPVELAARGALVDLGGYITEDIYDDFSSQAWVPFRYNNGVYAMPESEVFNVMYYRTDVFEQLGITVPDTWESLYRVMEVIQSNNLTFGMSEVDSTNMGVSASLGIFASLLTQRGGMYYTDDLSKTQFDTESAYEAFTQWCRFYTDYGLDRQYDFYSRFRTGEIPLAFGSISTYAQLYEAAPEIRGLWKMALIPGTLDENGKLIRSESSTVTGAIMLKSAEDRGKAEEAYKFMKWWVSDETQSDYGSDLEVVMGIAGRYYSANLKAFSKINWNREEAALIETQRSYIINQPTVIGNYAVNRDLTSALREVINGQNRPRRALMLYNQDINEELARKREEFKLNEK